MSVQPLEFPIEPKIGAGLKLFFYSQLFVTPPVPKTSFANQTIIITGSNVGLGLEAARHFYRLGAARLILAVRTASKGETAKEEIVKSVKSRTDTDAIEVWTLDQGNTQSVLAFVDRVKTDLPRVDVLVANAGINSDKWIIEEGYEQAVQVNVLNTFLLALSLLPILTQTKSKFPDSAPHLTIVSSEAHRLTKFTEINAPELYEKLNEESSFSQQPRYQATKLLEVLLTREIVARLPGQKSGGATPVIVNIVNPGLCSSNLDRSSGKKPLGMRVLRRVLDRTTEVGGRTFVLAASAPASSHGEFQSDGKNQDVEGWIYTDLGKRVQRKVWEQTVKILETRKPGIVKDAGL